MPRRIHQPVQHGFRTRVPCGAKPLAAEDKPCAAVGDGQRVAVLPITGLELTFEIDTPGVVRRGHRLGGLAGVARVSSSPLLLDQAVAGEQVTDGRPRRPRDPRVPRLQDGEELLGPPIRVLASQLEDGFGDLDGECPTGSRKSAATVNTSYPTFCISAMLSSSRSRCAFSIQRCS